MHGKSRIVENARGGNLADQPSGKRRLGCVRQIRHAMDKLDNGSADRPSPILMEIMDKTQKMECGFKNRLDTVIAGMKANVFPCLRLPEEEKIAENGTAQTNSKSPAPLIGETAKAAKVELGLSFRAKKTAWRRFGS
ncbi:hypothetical protein GQ600_1784 [Phytophthora cactorum]|nr:hypothetical protein GQ600_1784 [Phytophthora cactorum]